ncbi:hypothetical protein ACOBQJ_00740 [Pelotomaculum propionicicum]|uniref:hypothetical protein n=1 Tax=Pelotomaculum propionicicum TaxID=258475 RepID=UPI003B7C7A8E
MFNRIFAIVLVISLMTAVMAGAEPVQPNTPVKEDIEFEIAKVVKGAVEDTSWLHASSRQEMESLLTAYYTGDLLNELGDSGWRFVSRPNDWEYITSAGRIDVVVISHQEGAACAEILEKDELSGMVYSSTVRYFLIKTGGGWRIRAKTHVYN